jgi:Glycosyltransferase family 87
VNRPAEMLRGTATAVREQLSTVSRQPERTFLLGTVLLASAVSAATCFVLARCYSIDVLGSLTFSVEDCYLDWGTQIGRHCFSDYGIDVGEAMRPNPWEPYPLYFPWTNYGAEAIGYPAAGMVWQLLFGVVGVWLHSPRLGLLGFLLVSTIAVLTPAVWAARGARGLERVVVFVALGVAAVPAWGAIDRGNSVALLAPIGLVFLVALRRQSWGLVAVMVVVAALLKPQFALLAVALLAARQWRLGGLTIVGVVISNLAAYLLWPRDFPRTIVQSILTVSSQTYSGGSPSESVSNLFGPNNRSFEEGIFFIPDKIAYPQGGYGYGVSNGFLDATRLLTGYVVLVVVVGCVLALGRRLSPVMAGIALLATASLFPALTNQYYLVFALPVAALVARDPDGPAGSGIFEGFAAVGDRRRGVGICVSLAAALSIAQIPLPGLQMQLAIPGQLGVIGVVGLTTLVYTTGALAPLLWLIACAAIIVSYARRPVPGVWADASTTSALDRNRQPVPTGLGVDQPLVDSSPRQ